MSEWKEYTGSQEQITAMSTSEYGYMLRFYGFTHSAVILGKAPDRTIDGITHYLICDPHPRRDMIKQQADTGQEVWIKVESRYLSTIYNLKDGDEVFINNTKHDIKTIKTTKPDWNIPNAEYSFTPFED